MIYIIALENHFFQFVGIKNKELPEILREYVNDFLRGGGIDVIAEEFVKDPKEFPRKEVVCETIANEKELKHLFVEMSLKQRTEEGIDSKDHAAREAHWLEMINDDLNAEKDILFLCGLAHKKSFKKLLKANNHDKTVVKVLRPPTGWESGKS